ncbi:hypothetical protein [Sporolactobacillus terrae]|uniref:hypothetical protein n=1 Tax=Sporolactobacillus terrae TaxID=269673 RepID=UPI00049120E2|nr:hypothetical protein [Sporolactobacillus terrae]
MELIEVINYIKINHPEKAIDLLDSLDLVKSVIEDTLDSIQSSMNQSFAQRNFERVQLCLEIAKTTHPLINKIDKLLTELDIDGVDQEIERDENYEKRTVPNYEEYVVDNRVEHTLYENFTFKRPYGYRLNSKTRLVEVKTWHDMLLSVCEILFSIDRNIFLSLEKDKSMNGRKKKYFSMTAKGMREPRLIAEKVYIETNLSGNSIRNLIIKLLKKYDKSVELFKVYFRADYTEIKD